MDLFLLGGISVGSAFAGLLFHRFWRQTSDRFFLFFALSFWIEAGNRVLQALNPELSDASAVSYVIRLVSYGLILLAILDKNRGRN